MAEYEKAWAWFLLAFIPVIGPAIIWLVKKDKNEGLAKVAGILAIAQLLAIVVPMIGWLLYLGLLIYYYFQDKENIYRAWYMYFGLGLIGWIVVMVSDTPSEVKKDVSTHLVVAFVLALIVAAAVVLYGVAMFNVMGSMMMQ